MAHGNVKGDCGFYKCKGKKCVEAKKAKARQEDYRLQKLERSNPNVVFIKDDSEGESYELTPDNFRGLVNDFNCSPSMSLAAATTQVEWVIEKFIETNSKQGALASNPNLKENHIEKIWENVKKAASRHPSPASAYREEFNSLIQNKQTPQSVLAELLPLVDSQETRDLILTHPNFPGNVTSIKDAKRVG